MKFARLVSQVLDCDELFSMNHRKEEQARIDVLVANGFVPDELAQYHCTCAAITFSASFFDSLMSRKAAQVIENGGCGSRGRGFREVNRDDAAV